MKRVADTDLNHENWDDEPEKVEETGPFRQASAEDLSTRKILTPRRTLANQETPRANPFANFAGFGTPPATSGSSSAVSSSGPGTPAMSSGSGRAPPPPSEMLTSSASLVMNPTIGASIMLSPTSSPSTGSSAIPKKLFDTPKSSTNGTEEKNGMDMAAKPKKSRSLSEVEVVDLGTSSEEEDSDSEVDDDDDDVCIVDYTDKTGESNIPLKVVKERLGKYVKQLNAAFLKAISDSLKEDPEACLIPAMSDYMQHFKDIMNNPANTDKWIRVPGKDSILTLGAHFQEMKDIINDTASGDQDDEENSEVLILEPGPPQAPTPSCSGTKDLEPPLSKFVVGHKSPTSASPLTFKEANNGKASERQESPGFQFQTGLTAQVGSPTPPKMPFAPMNKSTPPTTGFAFGWKSDENKATSSPAATLLDKTPSAGTLAAPPAEAQVPQEPQNKVLTASEYFARLNAQPKPESQFKLPDKLMEHPVCKNYDPSTEPTFSFTDLGKTAPPQANGDNSDDEENDEPPKIEFVQVTEEDVLYQTKCKLFRKVDDAYKDGGVGMLYLKMLENEKYQIVVRAENTLGTVMLNMLLTADTMLTKQGKNNVSTIEPPGPGNRNQPTLLLIRVKDSDACDLLLENLQDAQSHC